MAKHKHLVKTLMILCLFIGSYLFISFDCLKLRRNVSDSLPFWIFKGSSVKEIEKGMYVSIKHPCARIHLAKQVVGCPGEQIEICNNHIFVEGIDYGIIFEKGRSGKPLQPIEPGVIPKDYFFVHASHPESFDSRYKEFGLVSINQIEEVLWPLF